jgi:hypothetical protein
MRHAIDRRSSTSSTSRSTCRLQTAHSRTDRGDDQRSDELADEEGGGGPDTGARPRCSKRSRFNAQVRRCSLLPFLSNRFFSGTNACGFAVDVLAPRLIPRRRLNLSGGLTGMGNNLKAARLGVLRSGRSLSSWGSHLRHHYLGRWLYKLSVTTHDDRAIRDGNVR